MEVREVNPTYAATASGTDETALPEYKQTEVGEVPPDWIVRSLSEISSPVRGGSPRPAGDPRYFNGDFIPWLTVAALTNIPQSQIVVSETAASLTELGSIFSRTLLPGTLIIANSGATLGVAKILGIKCCANDGIAALLSFSRSVSAHYLAYVINAKTDYLRSVVATGNGQPNLNTDLIGNFKVAFPPRKLEQEAIAEALSDADALIESLEQLIAKKRQIKQGTMQALLAGKQRLPGFLGEWSTKKFGEIATLRRDRIDPRKSLELEFCVELEHIGSGTGSLLGSSDAASQSSLKSVFQAGDVLFGKLRAYLRKYWFADRSGVCSTEIWCLTPKEMLRSKALLFYLVQMDGFIDAASLAYGTHMPRSDWNAVKEVVLRIPQDDEEQDAIANILTDMDTELAELETRLAKIRQLKQGMMQELLTGRIRLVQPASNFVPLPEKTEVRTVAARPHNQQINEAVVIAALVKQFGSEDWPLARVRRTKLAYLLHRHAEGRADGFLKMAAGPYNPKTRYKGPEGIALKRGYVQALHNGTYEGFVASKNISEAEAYFEKWYGADVVAWLEQFRLRKTDELELLTTVDMAVEDLRREGKPISVDAVKQLIHDHPEWEPKLERAVFSDAGIAGALAECRALFAS